MTDRPIIPGRVPVGKAQGSGPKVQISKFPMVKKNMDNGTETVHGVGGAAQIRSVNGSGGARARPASPPESSHTPGLIRVKMDGAKSVVLERPALEAAPALPPAPTFELQHAVLCRLLVNERLESLAASAPEEGDDEINAGVNSTREIEIEIATQAAEALDIMIAQAQQPRPAAVRPAATRNGAVPLSMRSVVATPRPQFGGVLPRRSPATAPITRKDIPADLAAVIRDADDATGNDESEAADNTATG